MDHDHGGGVGVHGAFQVCAEVTYQVPFLPGPQFIVVEHGHRGIDHNKA